MDEQNNRNNKNGGNLKIKTLFFLALVGILIASSGIFESEDKKKSKAAPAEILPMPEIKLVETTSQIGTTTITSFSHPKMPGISARSFLSVFSYDSSNQTKILAEKDSDKKIPLASITKLMTAVIASENISPEKKIVITEETLKGKDGSLKFLANDTFTFRDLLFAMLIESNNDAAKSFAEEIGKEKFFTMMNEKAQKLGMTSTYYGNATGLDPELDTSPIINHSSAKDLFVLAEDIFKNHSEILPITTTKEFDVYKANDGFNHKAQTTNKILENGDSLDCGEKTIKILGGKTGFTDLALKNLILITESPTSNAHLINIVLGSKDHFEDMTTLIDWVCDSYNW